MRRSFLAVVLLATVVAPSVAADFTSATLTGTWTGTWKNLRFANAKGPFTIVVTAPDANTITIDASQADFGCGTLASTVSLVNGTNLNAAGAQGTFTTGTSNITLTYKNASHLLTGTGSNCHGTWTLRGKFTVKNKKFKGRTVTVTSVGKAASIVRARRTS